MAIFNSYANVYQRVIVPKWRGPKHRRFSHILPFVDLKWPWNTMEYRNGGSNSRRFRRSVPGSGVDNVRLCLHIGVGCGEVTILQVLGWASINLSYFNEFLWCENDEKWVFPGLQICQFQLYGIAGDWLWVMMFVPPVRWVEDNHPRRAWND